MSEFNSFYNFSLTFMPKLAGRIRDVTGSYDGAFYVAGGLLVLAIVLALIIKKPVKAES